MAYVIAYLAALAVFGVADVLWLSVAGPLLYKPILGDILAPAVRIGPAIAFYLLFPVGVIAFAAMPAVRAESLATALGYGLLFGFIAYGTYDLTNYATLRNWTLSLTALDMAYGALLSAAAAAAAYAAARAFNGWAGA
jgi:uncharacterized membrane protein